MLSSPIYTWSAESMPYESLNARLFKNLLSVTTPTELGIFHSIDPDRIVVFDLLPSVHPRA